jgi:hypothetical protein
VSFLLSCRSGFLVGCLIPGGFQAIMHDYRTNWVACFTNTAQVICINCLSVNQVKKIGKG